MKNLLLSILLSINIIPLSVIACGGYYPYPDERGVALLKPDGLNLRGFESFLYSGEETRSIEYIDTNLIALVEPAQVENLKLWSKRWDDKISLEDINRMIYLDGTLHDCLEQSGDDEAIEYIEFARSCNPYNRFYTSDWEYEDPNWGKNKQAKLNKSLEQLSKTSDRDLTQRYAFLAIRLAYYSTMPEQVESLYTTYFSLRKHKTIIDYWALYFKCLVTEDGPERNFGFAQVFAHAADKRFSIYQKYNRKIDIEKTLALAETDSERSAVWMTEGMFKTDKAFIHIEKSFTLNDSSQANEYLLLREVNKLEEWLRTPYYSGYDSWNNHDTWSDKTTESNIMQKRMKKDSAYAKKLLALAEQQYETLAISLAKAHLLQMCGKNKESLKVIEKMRKHPSINSEAEKQLDILEAVCLLESQKHGKAKLIDKAEKVAQEAVDSKNDKVLLTIARALEYRGNTTDAALMMSKIDQSNWDIFWISKLGHTSLYSSYYSDYYFYVDAEFTEEQLVELINEIEKNKGKSQWKFSSVEGDLSRLYDLLGMKYMRTDQIAEAAEAFEKTGDNYWLEDDKFRHYEKRDPFYTDFYRERDFYDRDTCTYTKTEIAHELHKLLEEANDESNPQRHIAYFKAANCYLNMSQYGNWWLMKRLWWSYNKQLFGLPDDEDYLTCKRAKTYYLKAKEYSPNKKFEALCLKMAARCVSYKQDSYFFADEKPEYRYSQNYNPDKNPYYIQLKNEYFDYYDEMISNCYSFDKYFEAGLQN